MAGFHIGVRGKAAGQIVRCAAREGACKLTGADGEPTPHFASLADGEAYLAEQENARKAAFAINRSWAAANNDTSAGSSAAPTEGDTSAGVENEIIDYDEITSDALQSHNDILEPFESVTGNLENLNSNREWFSQYIVSPTGDIPNPHLFPTSADKIKLLEQSYKYFTTASETEESLNAIARSLQATLGSDAALALTAEVHRLTHQEGEVGDLLRDLQDKGALKVLVIPKPNKGEHTFSFYENFDIRIDDDKRVLLGQASEKLRETMDAYPRSTIDAMRTYTFKEEIDGNGWPYDSYYLLYTHELKPVQDMKTRRNTQLFAAAVLADFDDSISKYKKAESDLYALVENAAVAYNKAQEHSRE